jgi:hypothetical protein
MTNIHQDIEVIYTLINECVQLGEVAVCYWDDIRFGGWKKGKDSKGAPIFRNLNRKLGRANRMY